MIPIGKTFYKKIEKENKIMHENMVFKYPETVSYIYSLLSTKDLIWLHFYKDRNLFMAYLSSYIVEDFSFVKQSSYAESVKECYDQYLKYKKDDEELNIQNYKQTIYKHSMMIPYVDTSIPKKWQPFISINNYMTGKFPIPMYMREDFIVFLFHYLQKNRFLVNLGYKVNPWFLTNKNNKYYKPRFEINTMFDREIKKMAQKLIEKYGEQEEKPLI